MCLNRNRNLDCNPYTIQVLMDLAPRYNNKFDGISNGRSSAHLRAGTEGCFVVLVIRIAPQLMEGNPATLIPP
jgi:hypothetical protein